MNQMSIKKAALINAFSKYLTILLNLLFNAVLARLLLPEEFGIVAVITVFTTFFSVIADLGVGTGVIQNKGLTDKDINNIFSFTVYVALLIGVIFWCISKPLSIFYGNGIYISLGHLLAISVFFSTINMVPNALLMKEKRFISMALRTVVSNILSSVLAVIFAFKGFGAYSLVFQSLMNSVILFAWNYLNTRPAFRFKVEFVSILKIKSYSGYQFLFSFINYFSRNIDNLLIGRTMGESVLGYYDKAYKLMLYPTNNLTHVITPVLHPILSEYQNDKKYIYEKYMEVVRILSLLGILIMPVCFWCGEEIICIVFGEQWSASVYCFQILSLSAWAQMIASSSGSIFQSLGKTKNLFIQGCITSGVTIAMILLGILHKNIEIVAVYVCLAYNMNFVIVYYILVKKTFYYSFVTFMKTFIIDISIFGVLMIVGYISNCILEKIYIDNFLESLFIKSGTIMIAYVILLKLTGLIDYLYKYVKRK